MQVVLASSNAGKVEEFSHMLRSVGIEIIPQSVLAITPCEETAPTFIENALLKARHAAKIANLPAIADDSGLCVNALSGAPGVHSACFAGAHADGSANIAKLLTELKNIPDEQRGAFFYCSLVFVKHATDPIPLLGEGRWQGSILREPRGKKGFGYDPIFYIPELKKSAAELTPEQKNKISHRGIALQSLLNLLDPSFHWDDISETK